MGNSILIEALKKGNSVEKMAFGSYGSSTIPVLKDHRSFKRYQKSAPLNRSQMFEIGLHGAKSSTPFGFGIERPPVLPDHDSLAVMLPEARYKYALQLHKEALAWMENKVAMYSRLSGKSMLWSHFISMDVEKIETWFTAEKARYVDYLNMKAREKLRGARITLREIREAASTFLNEKPLAKAIAATINS